MAKTKNHNILKGFLKLFVKPFNFFIIRKKQILAPLCLTVFILFISYLFSNLDVVTGGEPSVLKLIGTSQNYLLRNKLNDPRDLSQFTFINVEHDQMLVDSVYAGNPITIAGNEAIADRKKLYRFLKYDEQASYKYIIIDIDLNSDYQTDYNDSLFEQISKMPSLVIAGDFNHSSNIDDRIKNKQHWVYYTTTILNSDLSKVPIMYRDTTSIAYQVYKDLRLIDEPNYNGIKHVGFLYFDNWSLSRRVIYPKLYITDKSSKNESDSSVFNGINLYHSLGYHILDDLDNDFEYYSNEYINDKIIIIGYFDGNLDIHNTYRGELHGPLIIANTILSLQRGVHHVSFFVILLFFAFFFIVAYFILTNNPSISLTDVFFKSESKQIGKRLIPIALLWTYYTLALALICAFVFLVTSETYDILFTSTFLTVISFVVSIIRYKSNQ